MAGRPTLWGAGQILRAFISRSAEIPPNFYLALAREIPPNPYISGAELDEPTIDDGYQRVEIANSIEMWGDTDSGQLHLVANGDDISFITATTEWGRCRYWALCNADTDGYVYFYGRLIDPVFVEAGDQVVVGAGELVVEFGPFFLDEEEV